MASYPSTNVQRGNVQEVKINIDSGGNGEKIQIGKADNERAEDSDDTVVLDATENGFGCY